MHRPVHHRRLSRAAAIAALAALSALLFAACGSEDTQELTFEVTSQGKTTSISGPESADAGSAEITLENKSKGEADLQLIRVEGERTPAEVVAGLGKAIKGQAFPEWFFAGGGVGGIEGGESETVTQVLEPGTYYAFDTEGGQPDPKSVASFEIDGEASDDEVEGDATVTASEYEFDAETLPSGEVQIAFENDGKEPHHLIASRLIGDATAADVEKFFKTEKGKPPLEQKGTVSTAVIEGGEGQSVDLDLEPGRYAFYCFITDREGGPPHAFKGMVSEIEVK